MRYHWCEYEPSIYSSYWMTDMMFVALAFASSNILLLVNFFCRFSSSLFWESDIAAHLLCKFDNKKNQTWRIFSNTHFNALIENAETIKIQTKTEKKYGFWTHHVCEAVYIPNNWCQYLRFKMWEPLKIFSFYYIQSFVPGHPDYGPFTMHAAVYIWYVFCKIEWGRMCS